MTADGRELRGGEPATERATEPRVRGSSDGASSGGRSADRRDPESQPQSESAGQYVPLKVFRYDPEIEGKAEPRFDEFRVPYERGLTVLDALIYARDEYYLGPAPIVEGYRFYMDEREGEQAQQHRLEILSQGHGVGGVRPSSPVRRSAQRTTPSPNTYRR